jgi:hypothetical protein
MAIAKGSKNYPNWYFWFENMLSGSPALTLTSRKPPLKTAQSCFQNFF